MNNNIFILDFKEKYMDYLKINKKVYEQTAQEFFEKIPLRIGPSKRIVEDFDYWAKKCVKGKKVLELGPGSGYISKLLIEKGYDVTAIEFSSSMAKIAKKTAPNLKIIVDEFLQHDFKSRKYSGIIAIAFVHLFPKKDLDRIIEKSYNLLCNSSDIMS